MALSFLLFSFFLPFFLSSRGQLEALSDILIRESLSVKGKEAHGQGYHLRQLLLQPICQVTITATQKTVVKNMQLVVIYNFSRVFAGILEHNLE